LHLLDTGTLAHGSIAWPASFRAFNYAGGIDVAFVDTSRVLAWNAALGMLLDIDLNGGNMSSLSTSVSAVLGPMFNNTLLYAPGSGNAYAARATAFGPQAVRSDIVTFDIDGRTWSSRQFDGNLTIPALTPSERVLVVELPGVSYAPESLALYEPASQQLSRNLCGAPFFNVSDMKVVAS
jgi:hypothetical protein